VKQIIEAYIARQVKARTDSDQGSPADPTGGILI
jgi:hypothetical protein